MTNPTPHGQLPETLRLADELEIPIEGYPEATELERNAAAELRRLHAYCQELEAQVILDCMTHVQNPAENEHVAGDVSKNGVKLNISSLAHELFALAQRAPGEGIEDAVARISATLHTQQPAPATQQAAGNSGFDHKTAADFLSGKTVSDEALRKFVAASRGAHDDRAALRAQMLALRGVLASREAEIALLKRSLLDAEAAPQPSPTAQAAESVPAIQGETNVQLDTDSNPTAPGQQRDMACSLALGQPMGNGQDQAAGHLGAQGDKLLTVAERNIRSFLRSATFKSESDREAALNCVDVLWEAARAPAESMTAPVHDLQDVRCECCGYMTSHREHMGCIRAARAPAPSVLEDAARLYFDAGWKACANFCDRDDVRFDGIVGHRGCPQFEEAFRAARKQGGAT